MKIFSTRNFLTKTIGAFAIVLSGSMVMAQATFTVDAPASLAGENPATIGLFGQNNAGTMVTGEIAIAMDGVITNDPNGFPGSISDGCEALTNDVSGKIVLVDRVFTCNAFNASLNTSGAIAMLVCPNSLDANYEAFVSPRGNSRDSDLPVFSLSLENCTNIKMAITNGEVVSGTYNINCAPDMPEGAVWGTTFGDAAADWKFEGSGWVYDEDGYMGAGAISGGALDADGNRTGNFGYALTPSQCDGALVFDSDFWDNGGNRDSAGDIEFGTGDCACVGFDGFFLPVAERCNGSVTSPTIDISASSAESFSVSFVQEVRDFLGEYYVIYSGDNGTTWDTVQINQELEQAGPITIERITVPMCGVSSSSDLVVKLRHIGGYYFWVVDDLYIVEDAVVEVSGNENFYATAPNYRTPVTQPDIHAFLIDVENRGNFTAADVNVNASISNSAGTSIYSADRAYGSVGPCAIDENKEFTDVFDMTGIEVGTYQTTYTTTSSNNSVEAEARVANWEISNDVFAKVLPDVEAGTPYLGNFGATTLNYISHGNAYYITQPGYKAVSMRSGISPQDGSDGVNYIAEVIVELFEWYDDNGDGGVQLDERTVVGEAFIELERGDFDEGDFEVVFESVDGSDEIILTQGAYYLAMAHISTLDPVGYALRFKAADVEDDRSFDFAAMRLATDSVGMPRFATMLASGGAFDDVDSRVFGPVGNLTSFSPLTIAKASVGTEDINEDINLSIFPNPASDFINIEFDLNEVSERVNVTLTDTRGQIALTKNFKNVKNNTLKIATEEITPGAYVANIRTDAGFTSQKIMVIR